jgi:transcriptional regulator with XRE-family HTH domain
MPMPEYRPDPQPPLDELIALRLAKYPGMMQRDFADKLLGVTRLHMTNVEQGRRRPSVELMLRWLDALAPEARIEMFGTLPLIERRIRALQKLQKVAPSLFAA